MTAQDIDAAFRARVAKDRKLAEIRRKIAVGKATFRDTAAYSERISNLLGETLSGYIDSIPVGERAKVCKWLLRNQYTNTNEMLAAVQKTLDRAEGIAIAPQKPTFPTERVSQVAGSLEDITAAVEVIRRRANAPVANVSKSLHDDYIKRNAEFRSGAGLQCYIVRVAAPGCCQWCTQMAGRYEYHSEPHDVYRRHDNCSCTVTYENGRMRQDVWSKRKWEAPEPDAGAAPPTVFTDENRPPGFRPRVLTDGAESGKMKSGKQVIKEAFQFSQSSDELVDAIIQNHAALAEYTPASMKAMLEELGYEVRPLGKQSRLHGIPFEEGGGYRTAFYGDGYFQYHPEIKSHHGGAYWKIRNGKVVKRYDMDGNENNN